MKKNGSRILIIALVALAVLIVVVVAVVRQFDSTPADPHAGHDHSSEDSHATTDTHTTTNKVTAFVDKDTPINKCFNITKAEDGTYSYTVTGRNGGSLLKETRLAKKPVIEVINDNLLAVINTNHPDPAQHAAVFCNVQRCIVSSPQKGFLCTMDDKVVYWTQASGAYHVFAVDPFDNAGYGEHLQTLEGLYVLEGETVDITCTKTKSGNLKITYPIKDDVKSIVINVK